MTEKPILFSGAMVRAILDGRKTMTRRDIKIKGYKSFSEFGPSTTKGYDWSFRRADKCWCDFNNEDLLKLQPHHVGDQLWVREAWRTHGTYDRLKPSDVPVDAPISYEASRADGDFFGKLRPSMFMCRWMSRITLEVTAVKVERLQDISEADAMAEGIHLWPAPKEFGTTRRFAADYHNGPYGSDYRHGFSLLWESINGPGSWEANPWVAAYSFKVINPQPIKAGEV
jgi:hypothetical protein